MNQFYQQPRLTYAVKYLLIAIAGAFVLQLTLSRFFGFPVEEFLGFSPEGFIHGKFWQVFTYPFLHGNLTHILFNCLILYMLGSELEIRWGTKKFLKYYAVCAVGGALLQTLIWLAVMPFNPAMSASLGTVPIIGASGALYGLFMAFGKLYKDAQVLVFFMFPMRARNFVILLGAIEVISAVFYQDDVAHLVHIGGLITGFILLKLQGDDLDGGWWRKRRRAMGRDEVRSRLRMVVNKDEDDKNNPSGKYPITWN